MTVKEAPTTVVERLGRFVRRADLIELCEATQAAIRDGNGIGWLAPPPLERLEAYWKGVVLMPERELFVARLDGTVAGSAQLVKPTVNQEARAFAATLQTHFVAPWARGFGLARALIEAVERAAVHDGFEVMQLDVRETQTAAIALYESCGYRRWGTLPCYARVEGRMIAGHYYVKHIG